MKPDRKLLVAAALVAAAACVVSMRPAIGLDKAGLDGTTPYKQSALRS
jgi:hypothetical protein